MPTLEFAPEVATAHLDGHKDTTVRCDDADEIDPGDRVHMVRPDGDLFAKAWVDVIAEVAIRDVPAAVDVLGGSYPHDTTADVLSALSRHYDADLAPTTEVRVLRLNMDAEYAVRPGDDRRR